MGDAVDDEEPAAAAARRHRTGCKMFFDPMAEGLDLRVAGRDGPEAVEVNWACCHALIFETIMS